MYLLLLLSISITALFNAIFPTLATLRVRYKFLFFLLLALLPFLYCLHTALTSSINSKSPPFSPTYFFFLALAPLRPDDINTRQMVAIRSKHLILRFFYNSDT